MNNKGNLHYIAQIEEACISSRHLPIEYENRKVRDIYRIVKEVFKPVAETI